MPPSLQEWLPEGDLAWFILDVVEQMDLKEFYAAYREDGWGAAAYNPGMMVGILLFAYCQGVRSSRRIAWALERDVGFRVVAANQQPDFRTICRFRAEREEALERLFVQVLRLCREAGLVKLYARLQSASRIVCGPRSLDEAGSLEQLSKNKACYRNALSKAVAKFDNATLDRIHAG